MTDVPALFSPVALRWRVPRPNAVSILHGVVVTALVAGVWAGHGLHDRSDIVDPQLSVLLRFMALMKLAGALGAAALVHWRFRRTISAGLAGLYVGAVGAMAIAPGLIWGLTDIAVAALAFHAGLLVFLVTAWRDDGASAGALPLRLAGRPTTMTDGTTAQRHR